MKALFTTGSEVPFARVVADHRRVLVPLGALLAINLGVLVLLVLPLRTSVESGGARAQASSLATTVGWLIEVPGTTPLPPTGLDMLQAYELAPTTLQQLLIA
ncbi:MAG: hypothetical protein Q8N52_12595, partial [Acidobacteriota bacterium]|nr:hypothetical protein [Acidobacteriota bacterium]